MLSQATDVCCLLHTVVVITHAIRELFPHLCLLKMFKYKIDIWQRSKVKHQAMQNTCLKIKHACLYWWNSCYSEKLKEAILKQDHSDLSDVNQLVGSRHSMHKGGLCVCFSETGRYILVLVVTQTCSLRGCCDPLVSICMQIGAKCWHFVSAFLFSQTRFFIENRINWFG